MASSALPSGQMLEASSGDAATCAHGQQAVNALSYSYETCGNIDGFSYSQGLASRWAEVTARGPLRITIPGDETPFLTTAGPNETDFVAGTARRDGSIVRFTTDLCAAPPAAPAIACCARAKCTA